MKRRKFIACSIPTIIVAGCIDESSDPSEDEEDTSSDSEELIELQHSLEVLQSDLRSDEEPLALELTLENVGENPLEYEERRSALFWFETTDDADFILSPRDTLYDDESIFEYDTDSDHWVLDEYGSDMNADYQVGSLEPGDTHTETLWVVTPYNANPPEETPEELRFTGKFTVSETDENGLEEGEDESWEFTLVRKEDDQFHITE